MSGTEGISSLGSMLSSLQVSGPANVNSSATAGARTESAPQAAASGVDHTSLSQAARSATADSDVRMDKVASLQKAIAGGTYNIPAGAVADKLIQSMLG